MGCCELQARGRSGFGVRVVHVMMALALVMAGGVAGQSAHAQCNPQQMFKLLADDGADGDYLGSAVAIDGTTAIVGAFSDDDDFSYTDIGSAYLFDAATGVQLYKLVPTDGEMDDHFGWAVDISGSSAIVGACGDDDNGSASGSVYLFDATTGGQLMKLLPDDGAASDYFGYSVAMDGTTAIVGAHQDDDNGSNSGSAYLFDATTGDQITKLLPEDGAAGHYFGRSVAISGTIAIVGADGADDNGSDSGSAYLFDSTTGAQLAKLLPLDGEGYDFFGWSVAISGTTAIIGATGDDDSGPESGAAYLFDTASGDQVAKLLSDDGSTDDHFGSSVAISGTTALVGAYGDDEFDSSSGAAYLFDSTTEAQTAKLLPDDGALFDFFGWAVAIDGTSAVLGAFSDDDSGFDAGSAYLFDTCAQTGTIGAAYSCLPGSGTVPFATQMTVTLDNLYTGQVRRISGRINATLASGAYFGSWRAGYTNVAGGDSFTSAWTQNIPALGTVIGANLFQLAAEDVTPVPYNQPPYPPAGDTATASCTVTGMAP